MRYVVVVFWLSVAAFVVFFLISFAIGITQGA